MNLSIKKESGTQVDKVSLEFDPNMIRKDFPILDQQIRNKPLVYLDNAASTQKPNSVIDTISCYYQKSNSNVHRGVHYLSQKATEAYESSRDKVKSFVNAKNTREIIFVRGVTEAINLVATSFGLEHISKGDEILLSTMEHHSNIVPWQILCEKTGAILKIIPISDSGDILIEEYEKLLSEHTKIVSLTHVSNTLGTVNPIKKIIDKAHEFDIPVLIDGAQSSPHIEVDVQSLDCDFYTFSGHKIYGPTGIGVLYGKERYLEKMMPYQGGGDMIQSVTFEHTSYKDLPHKFEAGTPNIAGAIGLGAALDYLSGIGLESIVSYEKFLLKYALEALSQIHGVEIIGKPAERAGVISFLCNGIHPHDIGTILDSEGVAIRAGHHCTQPLMQRLGLTATARASLGVYTTLADIDRFTESLPKVFEVFN